MLSNEVALACSPVAGYGSVEGVHPELLGVPNFAALAAVRELFVNARFDADALGTPEWNPLADVIDPGVRVLIKPNWVLHENRSGAGTECLFTHSSVLEAILHYAVKAQPSAIIVGDAPVQGCDFGRLQSISGLNERITRIGNGIPIDIRDFRRTVLQGKSLGAEKASTKRTDDDYVIVDLGGESELEVHSDHANRFRVTMYDPDAMSRTHGPGRHRYLIAREVLDADVIINVPKLKTHKKAGVTGALKNLVGINGLKDYLPHHRKGGADEGGDCYAGRSTLKSVAENLLDMANRQANAKMRRALGLSAAVSVRLAALRGHDGNVEGSWHGNDTVWRMTLDLQRILHFAARDGSLQDRLQRRVLSITDAIVAGDGEGPLSPSPVPLGVMTMGFSAPAVEWVNALLMNFDPDRIPLIRNAFDKRSFPLASFAPSDIRVLAGGEVIPLADVSAEFGRPFNAPSGWRGHCELQGHHGPESKSKVR